MPFGLSLEMPSCHPISSTLLVPLFALTRQQHSSLLSCELVYHLPY